MPSPFFLPNMWSKERAAKASMAALRRKITCDICGKRFTQMGMGSHYKACSSQKATGVKPELSLCGVDGCTKPMGLCWRHEQKSDVFTELDSRIEKERQLRA